MPSYRQNLLTSVSESRLIRMVKSGWQTSRLRGFIRILSNFGQKARLPAKGQETQIIFESAVQTAKINRGIDAVRDWVSASFFFRWLTKEANPEVIVINLRNTYTVAPFINPLNCAIQGLNQSFLESRLRVNAGRLGNEIDKAPVQLVGIVLTAVTIVIGIGWALTSSLGFYRIGILFVLFGLGVRAYQTTMELAELMETRTVRILKKVLEPPKSPDEMESTTAHFVDPDRSSDG